MYHHTYVTTSKFDVKKTKSKKEKQQIIALMTSKIQNKMRHKNFLQTQDIHTVFTHEETIETSEKRS